MLQDFWQYYPHVSCICTKSHILAQASDESGGQSLRRECKTRFDENAIHRVNTRSRVMMRQQTWLISTVNRANALHFAHDSPNNRAQPKFLIVRWICFETCLLGPRVRYSNLMYSCDEYVSVEKVTWSWYQTLSYVCPHLRFQMCLSMNHWKQKTGTLWWSRQSNMDTEVSGTIPGCSRLLPTELQEKSNAIL